MECCGLRPFNSPLSEEIIALSFLRKFVMPTFNHCSGTSDTLLHLCQFQDNMAVYALDDLLLC